MQVDDGTEGEVSEAEELVVVQNPSLVCFLSKLYSLIMIYKPAIAVSVEADHFFSYLSHFFLNIFHVS